jgi:hypothetical protein
MNETEMDHLSGMNLEVDADAGRHITDAGKWAKFIAIVMFSLCGIALLALLIGSTYLARLTRSLYPLLGEYAGFGTGAFMAILVLIIGVAVFIYYLLFNFAQKAPAAVATEDAEMLNKGLRSLKLFFIISTVIAILSLLTTLYNLLTTSKTF